MLEPNDQHPVPTQASGSDGKTPAPEIWFSEAEGTVALRWPGDPAWYRIDHKVVSDDRPRRGFTRRGIVFSDFFRVGSDAWGRLPDPGWINPNTEIVRLQAEVLRLRARPSADH
jgi:hypothetical protein